jgi:hypothetical protein
VKRKICKEAAAIAFQPSIRELIRTEANGGHLTATEIRTFIADAIADPTVTEIYFDEDSAPVTLH